MIFIIIIVTIKLKYFNKFRDSNTPVTSDPRPKPMSTLLGYIHLMTDFCIGNSAMISHWGCYRGHWSVELRTGPVVTRVSICPQ